MIVKVKLFATLRENRDKMMVLDVEKNTTPRDIILSLGIAIADVAIIMINGRGATYDSPLADADELALFPPVGGG